MPDFYNSQQVADGVIEPYAFPGGYDVTVMDDEGHTFHAECAIKDAAEYPDEPRKFEPFIHWEGEDMYCDHCSEPIKSQYGIPDEEQR